MDITATGQTYGQQHRTASRRRRGGRLYAAPRADRPDGRSGKGLSAIEVLVIVALIAAVLAAALLSGHGGSGVPARTATIKVGAGESLWSIAVDHPVAGLTTQQAVEVIRSANGLAGYEVAEGRLLQVPVQASESVALAR